MIPPEPPKKQEPVSTLPGKNVVMAIVILFGIVIIGVIAAVVLVQSPAGSNATVLSSDGETNSPAGCATASLAGSSSTIASTSSATTNSITVGRATNSPTGSSATVSSSGGETTFPEVVENSFGPTGSQLIPKTNMQPVDDSSVLKPVDFVIDTGAQEKCGLTCRHLTPSITNTGTKTAHNVCISIRLSNTGGDIIFLNGEPTIRKCIGNIASGESKSESIVINADCGFLASKCVKQTLILKTKATCDETTVQFPDQIIAV
jgi:hypothetical protein